MLSSSERRFLQSWKEQREGPAWKYYLQYTIAWATVTFLCLFFLTKLVISDRNMGGWASFYIVLAASLIIAGLVTHVTYRLNEKKFRKISGRENN